MIERLYTIGGYGHSKENFFKNLESHHIDVLVDVRQRRGLRGKVYAFLNSTALQTELLRRGIAYSHLKELAPTSDVRDIQKENDEISKEGKKERTRLSEPFKDKYREIILGTNDLDRVIQEISPYRRPCFFCVEGPPSACHRSLIVDWMLESRDFTVTHILP